ncbi:MAG: O-antigen ligase family protein [Armatimonadetes bacterium]|nr:O-antigen ligase family protein [Armatimonadota bacterium]
MRARTPSRRRTPVVHERAAAVRTPVSAWPAGLAILLLTVWGGYLGDRRVPDPAVSEWIELVATPIAWVAAGLAALAALWRDAGETRTVPMAQRAAAVLFAAVAALAALSAFWAPAMQDGLPMVAGVAGSLALGLAVYRSGRSKGLLLGLALVFVAGSSLVSLRGVGEFVVHFLSGDRTWRVFATFTMPNFLAGLLVASIPLTLAVGLTARGRRLAASAALGLLLQFGCLLLTQSRMGIASLLVAVGVLGVACWASGALVGHCRRRALGLLGVMLVVALLAAGPAVARLKASGDQAYSARFRALTWQGAARMVAARPLQGFGAGSFATAYPPYAVVGFTQHAHNTYLQLGCDSGAPAALCLLAALCCAWFAGWRALVASRGAKAPTDAAHGPAIDVRVVAAGALAGSIGLALHSGFDSDLYVPALASAMAVELAILLAASRMLQPGAVLAHQAPIRRWRRLAIGAVALGLAAYAAPTFAGRTLAYQGLGAIAESGASVAYDKLVEAAASEPWNAETRLNAAMLASSADHGSEAWRLLLEATRLSPTGKSFYRAGKHLQRQGKMAEAATWFDRARRVDPHFIPNLVALAAAWDASGRGDAAQRVYSDIAHLYEGPIGTIRAIPERIEWEFAEGYLGLAAAAVKAARPGEAVPLLQSGIKVLRAFWDARQSQALYGADAAAVDRAAERYEWALTTLEASARATGNAAAASDASAELGRLREARAQPSRSS